MGRRFEPDGAYKIVLFKTINAILGAHNLAPIEGFVLMKFSKRASVAFSIAALTGLGVASPAFAADYTGDDITFGDSDNTHWVWESFDDGSLYGLFSDTWTYADIYDWANVNLYGSDNNTYDNLSCSDVADLSVATDGSNDQIVLCDPFEIDNGDGVVTTQLEFRFYDDLKTVRTRAILTNNTDTAISDQVLSLEYDSYYDEETSIYGSTTGGEDDYATNYGAVPTTTITPDDFRWVTDDRMNNERGPVVSQAIGLAGSDVVPADNADRGFVSGGLGAGQDRSDTFFEVPSLAPGQSVEFVFMTQVWIYDWENATPSGSMDNWQTATGDAAAQAWADSTITSDALVFAGIDDQSKVLNWNAADESLADTGANATLPIGLATLLLGAGVATVAIRRRVTRN